MSKTTFGLGKIFGLKAVTAKDDDTSSSFHNLMVMVIDLDRDDYWLVLDEPVKNRKWHTNDLEGVLWWRFSFCSMSLCWSLLG